MPALDAVCFDLDGTLCVSAQDTDRLLARAFDDAGVDPLFDVDDLWTIDTSTLPTAETHLEFYTNLFREGAARAEGALSEDPIEQVAGAYLDHHDPTAVEPRDGALAALAAARDRYPVGLVTNGGASTQGAKLSALGIEDAFDVRVFCDPAAGIEPKPDPRPMERALEALGTPAERTLFVGNSLGADVAGAHATGMQSAWIPMDEPQPDPDPEPT